MVPAVAQATLAQVRAQVMPAAQAVQAASKSYVDRTIAELSQSLLTASGGNLTGPLYLNGDPSQNLQAATKHYADSLFSQAVPLTGAALTGPLTATRLGGVWQVDQFPGTDFGVRLQACVNALDPAYGGTCDARNFSGNQQMSATLTIPSGNTTVLLPCATISTASQIVVPAGVRNVTLRGCALRGGSAASGSIGGTAFAYSGAAAMVQVGDPAYAMDTSGFHMENAVINTTASSSAMAKAFAAYRTQELDLESLYLQGNANQTGMTLDGTGNYTGGTFLDDQIGGFQTAVNAIGHQVANSATTDWLNASTFLRLHINCPTADGSPIAGTVGINLQQGDGNTFTGGDVEGCATALHLGANAQNNTIVGLRNENSNQQVVADAGSSYNNWITGDTMFTGQLTDNGTRNSFLDTFHRSFNALNGDWYGSQQDTTLTNHFRLGIGSGNERGLLNRYQTDSGYRWTTGLSDASAGEQFYQVLDELNNVNRISIGQYNSGQSSTNNQTVINSAGTGAVVLNGSNGSGTGGVIFGSGGPSGTTVATVDKSGNAQFTGALQVGGASQSTGTMTVRNNADSEVDYYLWPGLTASQKGSFTYKDWNGSSQWYMLKDASNNWALNSAVGGLDSFKAYQSSNSGDTYINASKASGVVRVNYETGSGGGFKVYGGNSGTLYASFTGAASIAFPGLAAGSGRDCLQIDASGYVTNTGSACGTGSGSSGNVSSSTPGYIAYYNNDGVSISGTSAVPVTAGGTGATTPAQALASLGALPLAGGTVTGPINGTSATFSGDVAAGSTVSSPMTNGVQTLSAQTPLTAGAFRGNQKIELAPGATYTITSKLTFSTANNILDGKGATIVCAVANDHCLEVTNRSTGVTNIIRDLTIVPGVVSTGAAIHDAAQGLTLDHVSLAANGPYTFANGVQVDNDEAFVWRGAQAPGAVVTCNSTVCGAMVYNPAGTSNAAVGWLSDDNFSLGCSGNGINWMGGNDLHLSSVIIQSYSEYGLNFALTASGADGRVLASKVHSEMGNCGNPALNGINAGAGYIMNGGTLVNEGGMMGGNFPQLSATGATGTSNYAWYVVYSNGSATTAPMPVGYVTNGPSSFSGSTSVVVTWPSISNATGGCTLLRVNQTNAGRVAPSGTGAYQVATGISCSSGTFTTYTDSASDPLTSYTVPINPTYWPNSVLWPGSVVLTSGGGTGPSFLARYRGTCSVGYVFASPANAISALYPQAICEGPTSDNYSNEVTPGSAAFISGTSKSTQVSAIPGIPASGSAMILPSSTYQSTASGMTGQLNFGYFYQGYTDLATLYDSNINGTTAVPGNRRLAAPADAAIGFIGDGTVLGFRASAKVCQQINAVFAAGTTPQECLSSTTKTFTGVNLALSSAASFTQSNTASDSSTADYTLTAGSTAGSQGSGIIRTYGQSFSIPSLQKKLAFGANTASGGTGIVIFGNSSATSGSSGSVSIRAGGYDTAAENLLCSGTNCNVTHGTFQVGGIGVSVTVSSGTATMGTGAIAAGTCAAAVTVAATGVLATDSISWSFNAAPGTGWPALTVQTFPAAGNVSFLVCNPSAASVTPAAATLNWRVVR